MLQQRVHATFFFSSHTPARATTSTSQPRSTNQASDLETSWTSRTLSSGETHLLSDTLNSVLKKKKTGKNKQMDSNDKRFCVQGAILAPQLATSGHSFRMAGNRESCFLKQEGKGSWWMPELHTQGLWLFFYYYCCSFIHFIWNIGAERKGSV